MIVNKKRIRNAEQLLSKKLLRKEDTLRALKLLVDAVRSLETRFSEFSKEEELDFLGEDMNFDFEQEGDRE